MIIVAISDIHGHIKQLITISHAVKEADLVLISGDLTHFGRENEAREVIESIRALNRNVYAVPGNCDYPLVSTYLTSEGINLNRRGTVIGDYAFIGIGGSLPCPGRTPNEHTEDDFLLHLEEAKKEVPQGMPLILVSHEPPHGTQCDLVQNGIHVGSSSIRDFIVNVQPLICFTGHIHEARGIDTIGKTKVVNPGPLHYGGYILANLNRGITSLKIMAGKRNL